MKTQIHRYPYLPRLAIGIMVILFSTAGIAAMMGWRSASSGSSGKPVVLHDSEAATAVASAADTAQRRAKARANGRCAECGVIVLVREGNGHDDDFGIDAVDGAANEVRDEKPSNLTTRYETIVRMADGSSHVIYSASPARWRLGERVIFIAGTIPSHP